MSPFEVLQFCFVPVSPYELQLEPPLEFFKVFLSMFAPLEVMPVVDVALWGIYELLVCALVMVPFPPHPAAYFTYWFIVALLL